MKKIVLLLIMLFSAASNAQEPGWSTLKETNITVGSNAYDIFTNGAGNHIIVQEPTALKYYKMDVNGTIVINLNPPLESSSVTSPSISGDLTKLYVVYRKGTESKIKTKYSNNGGVSWSNISDLVLTDLPNSIECVFSKNKLYVSFLIGTSVYFNYYNYSSGSWLNPSIKVSGDFSATYPRIGINKAGTVVDTVYFTFTVNDGAIRWSRYYSGIGPIIETYSNGVCYECPLKNIGVAVDNKYLYSFRLQDEQEYLEWTVRQIYNNVFKASGISNSNDFVEKVFTAITYNDSSYIASWSTWQEHQNKIVRIGFNPLNQDPYKSVFIRDEILSDNGQTPIGIVNLSAAGNDIHVIWKDNLGPVYGNNLQYKYYDDIPIPPQSLTVTKSVNNHPLLSWINPNPDARAFDTYQIYRKNSCLGYWEPNPIAQTTALSYEDVSQSYCTAIPPARCENMCIFEYRVTTIDIGSKVSGYSNIVSVWLVGGPPQKAGVDDPVVETVFEYSLGQNYPNPFNPTTTISYSIQKTGEVTIKVYDMLGTEVASLVNENKETGNYTVEFNASELPSGIYFYTLTSGNFINTKKLILLK